MLLSICVAVITGTRARWQAAMICFWIAGTRVTSSSTPRSPRATITASASAMIASRLATRLRLLDLGDDPRAAAAALQLARAGATMSSGLPHERQPDVVDVVRRGPLQVGQVLLGQRRDAQAPPRAR